MKVLIIDDEPLAQDIIETYIELMPEIELVEKCTNAIDANKALKEHEIDLIFLDIQMPKITGLEFLKSLANPPLVIFTTAYAEHAIEGFELNAVDYLLKPISIDRFMKAVNKASALQKSSKEAYADEDDFVFIKADKKLMKLAYKDILYIEGLKDYVIIRKTKGRIITLQTMKSLEAKLPSHLFKRVHRSYIVNLSRIDAVNANMVELQENGQPKTLPIGKNYKDALLKIILEKKI